MKPGIPVSRIEGLLGQVRERIVCPHYSVSAEKPYPYRVKFDGAASFL
jgi:hypothetical protein